VGRGHLHPSPRVTPFGTSILALAALDLDACGASSSPNCLVQF